MSVLIFIHGGGYAYGTGIPQIYKPQFFIDYNIVVVTLNYRLGPLGKGFLNVNLRFSWGGDMFLTYTKKKITKGNVKGTAIRKTQIYILELELVPILDEKFVLIFLDTKFTMSYNEFYAHFLRIPNHRRRSHSREHRTERYSPRRTVGQAKHPPFRWKPRINHYLR